MSSGRPVTADIQEDAPTIRLRGRPGHADQERLTRIFFVLASAVGCSYVDNPRVDSTAASDTFADDGSSGDGSSDSSSTTDADTTDVDTTTADTTDVDTTTADTTDVDTTTGDADPFVFAEDPPEAYTRVDRMGLPAVATAVITSKDDYNAAGPPEDVNADFVPEIAANVTGLHAALDDDLLSIPVVPCGPAVCLQQAGPLVIPDTLKIDLTVPAGFPNGRMLSEQVIDVTLSVVFLDLSVMGQTPTTFADLPLNPAANDAAFLAGFPYLAAPN